MANIKFNKKNLPISDDTHALNHLATITVIATWQEVLDCYHELKQQFAPKRIFLVLDDEAQASYTSMHATKGEAFENDADSIMNDMELDDPKWSETFEEQVVPKQIEFYAEQLKNTENHIKIGSFDDKMSRYNADDLLAILMFNQDPLPVMDQRIVVKAGVFDSEPLKLALLPNGYFTCDFNPFENLAIITMMDDFGFEFIGLGASLLGFIKTEYFDTLVLTDLLSKLGALYHLNESTSTVLQTLIEKNNYLILPYSESPSELFE